MSKDKRTFSDIMDEIRKEGRFIEDNDVSNNTNKSFTGNILDHNVDTTEGTYVITVDLGDLIGPQPSQSTSTVFNSCCGATGNCICHEVDMIPQNYYTQGYCTCGSLRPDLHKVLSTILESLEVADRDVDEIEIARLFKQTVENLYGEREE